MSVGAVAATRVAPQCEMLQCANRADFMWHPRMQPLFTWLPVCVLHAAELADTGWQPVLAPLAETSYPLYRGSEHGT